MKTRNHLPPPIRARSSAIAARTHKGPVRRQAPTNRGPGIFRSVLVPLDLALGKGAALKTALTLAKATGAETTLLHVVMPLAGGPVEAPSGAYREREKAAARKLASFARPFRKKHLTVHEEVRVGDPVTEILASAKEHGSDLLLLDSHRFDPADPTRGWATVSYRAASLCTCPVLLAK